AKNEVRAAIFPWFFFFSGAWKPGMISGCEKSCACRTRTGSPVSAPRPPSGASSVIRRHASCPCNAVEKNACGVCGQSQRAHYDSKRRRVRDLSCGDTRVYLEFESRRLQCRRCGAVKQENLPWLADNPFYTKRFAFYVGRRCRSSALHDVARELRLDWKTVKALEMEYMGEQLRRLGTPAPSIIGIDEISIRKGHTYRIVVSDLLRGRAIWFGGTDRSEASMDQFFGWLGPRKSRKIRLAVMDMWPAFRNSTLKAGHAPQAGILYDKFHVLRHLSEAMD